MSFILDALRRAERERRAAPVPGLHEDPPAPPLRRVRVWPWILVGAVALNAGLLYAAWQIARRPAPPPVSTAKAVTAGAPPAGGPAAAPAAPAGTDPAAPAGPRPVRPAPAAPPARRPEPAPATAPPGEPARAAAATVVPDPRGPGRPPGPPRAAPGRGDGDPAASASHRPEPEPAPAPLAAPSPPATEPPAPGGAPPTPSPPLVASTPARPGVPAPAGEASPRRLPAAEPAGGPPPGEEALRRLALDVLVYSDVAAERLVFINGRKYVEGQAIEGGIVLERITPEGAVLRHEGRRVVLRPRLNPYVRP